MNEEFVSKTKRKQEMHALQALGAALLELSEARLAAMALPPELAQAVRAAQSISSHEARRRQVQYIGRLMRELDPEPIRAQLAAIEGRSAAVSAQHRRIEQWRARLLQDDAALTEFAREHPAADLQALRALLRNARRDEMQGRPVRAQREIYRLLRDAVLARPEAASE